MLQRRKRWGVVFLCVAMGMTSAGASAQRPKVLVDRSHEWLFAYDDLSERMLRPAGFDVVLCDASLDTKARLSDFDIVMVQQTNCRFPFSEAECALLTRYVEEGGNLVAVGNPKRPIAEFVSRLGVHLLDRPGRAPARPCPALLRHGADSSLQTRAIRCAVKADGPAEKLIVDGTGQTLALAVERGRGKVVVFADDSSYWDFCAQRDANMRVPNTATTVSIFKSLLSEPPPGGEGSPVQRLTGERTVHLPSVTVRYSNPIAKESEALLKIMPELDSFVSSINGGLLPTNRLVVNMLAADGGGWSGGREIGVQCGGHPAANIAVIAHETTHSYEGPLPGILSEGWASMAGMRAAKHFGYTEAAQKERRAWRRRYQAAEQGGVRLDLARENFDRAQFGAYEGKMMALVEELERRYGQDFMPRFLELKWALKNAERVSMEETLQLFSITAGADLSPLYASLGISLPGPSPFTEDVVKEQLTAYRAKVAQARKDRDRLAQYTKMRAKLDDSLWRSRWEIRDNLYKQAVWLEDGDASPPELRHLTVPVAPNRRGFLVVHAGRPDLPCRLERRVTLTENGAVLYLGAARRSGGRSVLRVLVDGKTVWSRALERDGWVHEEIDLTRFVGQTASLSLQVDTEGEWGCREVFVDYAILGSDMPS